MNLPQETQQVVLVTTPAWNSQTGTLRIFSKIHGRWVPAGDRMEVNVGRGGLGWGGGLHANVAEPPQKSEGDGRSPAGIFGLGSAFGYGDKSPEGVKLPYRHLDKTDFWVSDSQSRQYNQLVTLSGESALHPQHLWSSYETMRRSDGLYELGIIVDYNTSPVVEGKGSAIFLHVWNGLGSPTSGCTSMPKEKLRALMMWLDPAKRPLLIQAPVGELNKIKFAK